MSEDSPRYGRDPGTDPDAATREADGSAGAVFQPTMYNLTLNLVHAGWTVRVDAVSVLADRLQYTVHVAGMDKGEQVEFAAVGKSLAGALLDAGAQVDRHVVERISRLTDDVVAASRRPAIHRA